MLLTLMLCTMNVFRTSISTPINGGSMEEISGDNVVDKVEVVDKVNIWISEFGIRYFTLRASLVHAKLK